MSGRRKIEFLVPNFGSVGCVTENWTIRDDKGRFHSYAAHWKLSLELFQLSFSALHIQGLFVSVSFLYSSKLFQACNRALPQLRQLKREKRRERIYWECWPLRSRPWASTRPWRSTLRRRPPTPMPPRWVAIVVCSKMFQFSILKGKCRVGKLLSYPESFWWQNCPLDVHFLRLTTCTQII